MRCVWARYAFTFFLYARAMENPCTLSAGDNLRETHTHARVWSGAFVLQPAWRSAAEKTEVKEPQEKLRPKEEKEQ